MKLDQVAFVCTLMLGIAVSLLGIQVSRLSMKVAELSEPRRLSQADHEYIWHQLNKPAAGRPDMPASSFDRMEWETWINYANSMVLQKVADACGVDYSEAYRQAWIRTPIGKNNLEMEISRGMPGKIDGYSFGDIDTAPLTDEEKEMQALARKKFEEWKAKNIKAIREIGDEYEEVRDLIRTTTIAKITDPLEFTLTEGSPNDHTYRGMFVEVYDKDTGKPKAAGKIRDYAGMTKAVSLSSFKGFGVVAVGDTVEIATNLTPLTVTEEQ